MIALFQKSQQLNQTQKTYRLNIFCSWLSSLEIGPDRLLCERSLKIQNITSSIKQSKSARYMIFTIMPYNNLLHFYNASQITELHSYQSSQIVLAQIPIVMDKCGQCKISCRCLKDFNNCNPANSQFKKMFQITNWPKSCNSDTFI